MITIVTKKNLILTFLVFISFLLILFSLPTNLDLNLPKTSFLQSNFNSNYEIIKTKCKYGENGPIILCGRS